ncbi:hypothetical protein HNR60_002722 [Rhodopseudomonas rhenobacensis]|uniref:Uncharacterized protein n=1 Tax=Rhodopseudomonas rhenobacensis TaxID=87461 RepID=A0A7W7Z4P5_9BRAD|nr:hypothetical protein [Rhodopseudomonas rhenobacensis]
MVSTVSTCQAFQIINPMPSLDATISDIAIRINPMRWIR